MMSSESQMKAAQSQLEAAESQLKTAQIQIEKGRVQVESALKHLDFATAQKDTIDGASVETAKAGLRTAMSRFSAATSQLNAIPSQFDAAKSRLDLGSSCIAAENEKFVKMIAQLKSDHKIEVEEKMKEIAGLNSIRNLNITGINPTVFMDLTLRGAPVGRIVMELFADTTPLKVEIFRALCTGERGVSQTGKRLHYKNMCMNYVHHNNWMAGGDIIQGNVNEASSIYGDMRAAGENIIRKYTGTGDVHMFLNPENYRLHSFGINLLLDSSQYVRSVVIGKVVQGMQVVNAVNNAFRDQRVYLKEGELVITNTTPFGHSPDAVYRVASKCFLSRDT